MSEWKAGAAQRRDERATKTDLPTRRSRGKKDTRRWCRGKVGVEHVTLPVIWFSMLGSTYGWDECTNCRKKFRWVETDKSGRRRY